MKTIVLDSGNIGEFVHFHPLVTRINGESVRVTEGGNAQENPQIKIGWVGLHRFEGESIMWVDDGSQCFEIVASNAVIISDPANSEVSPTIESPAALDSFVESVDLPQEQGEPESVNLIASGYEWECPARETLNREVEVAESVTCEMCTTKYTVNDYNHATR